MQAVQLRECLSVARLGLMEQCDYFWRAVLAITITPPVWGCWCGWLNAFASERDCSGCSRRICDTFCLLGKPCFRARRQHRLKRAYFVNLECFYDSLL